jgi:hypothetical protein
VDQGAEPGDLGRAAPAVPQAALWAFRVVPAGHRRLGVDQGLAGEGQGEVVEVVSCCAAWARVE